MEESGNKNNTKSNPEMSMFFAQKDSFLGEMKQTLTKLRHSDTLIESLLVAILDSDHLLQSSMKFSVIKVCLHDGLRLNSRLWHFVCSFWTKRAKKKIFSGAGNFVLIELTTYLW